VIHDSDVMPGLTNKILSKYAAYIGTGSPIENYPNYSQDKTKFVGIPVDKSLFLPIANSTKREVLNSFGFTDQHPFLVVTGGGGGSQYLNDLTIEASRALSQNKIQTLLLTGKDHLAPKRYDGNFFRTEEFSSNLVDIFRVANIVVTRAGASSLAELAAAKKAIVLIPHPYLASNHQEKNAEIYQKSGAAIVLKQRELTDDGFIETVSNLAKDIERQKSLGAALGRFAKPDALSDMVDMILTAAGQYARKK